jgi:hypothetical protein
MLMRSYPVLRKTPLPCPCTTTGNLVNIPRLAFVHAPATNTGKKKKGNDASSSRHDRMLGNATNNDAL